jgi:hypothetical protein
MSSIEGVGRGQAAVRQNFFGTDGDQLPGIRVRQRAQHRGVDHREDRGRGADAERQCEHCDERGAPLLEKLAYAVADVLDQRVHRPYPPVDRLGGF